MPVGENSPVPEPSERIKLQAMALLTYRDKYRGIIFNQYLSKSHFSLTVMNSVYLDCRKYVSVKLMISRISLRVIV